MAYGLGLGLSKILEYLSTIPINVTGTNVYDLDDPEIFRHPIIYYIYYALTH